MLRGPETPLRILHLANHKSTNIGNGALIIGLERTLREDLTKPVRFDHEAWDDYTIPGATKQFDDDFVKLCRKSDCLVVGAAVTLVGSPKHAHTGMRFNLPLELWDAIECPILFYGLSYRTWPRQGYHHSDKLQAAIRHAVQSDRCLFSVRNDGTREWLKRQLGIDTDGVHVVPDPAVFVEVNDEARPWNLHSEKINIAVSFNDEDAHHRFSGPAVTWQNHFTRTLHPSRRIRRRARQRSDRRTDFVHKMANILDHLVDHFPLQIILCPHHHEDFRMIADFLECCSSRLKHQVVLVNGLPKSECAREFYNLYRRVDLTLAMRVHSMSPSIGLGTPTLALCSQPRMTEFMRDAGLSEYALDIFANGFEQALWQACQQILADATSARHAAQDAAMRLRARTQDFNRLLEQLVFKQVQHA